MSNDFEFDDSQAESQTFRRIKQSTMPSGTRILAGIGSGMLLIGLFLPMINAPFGVWLSFLDLPWKALTIGRGEELIQRPDNDRKLPVEAEEADRPKVKPIPPEFSAIMFAAMIGCVGYPLCIFAVIGVAFFLICSGRGRPVLGFMGIAALVGTILYGLALAALSSRNEFGLLLRVWTPGFGWGVVLLGCLAAFRIRPDSKRSAPIIITETPETLDFLD